MPRPKNPGAPEPKKRSRTGCWQCKAKKVKCGEEKPRCINCDKNNEAVCDYSIRLNWEGRSKRKVNDLTPEPQGLGPSSGEGQMQMFSFQPPVSGPPKHKKSNSQIDPALVLAELPTSARDFSINPPRSQVPQDTSRPSSAGSYVSGSPASSSGPPSAGLQQRHMLPPFGATGYPRADATLAAFSGAEHRDKRPRPSHTSQPHTGLQSPNYLSPRTQVTSTNTMSEPPMRNIMPAPEPINKIGHLPLTPSNSSVTSEETFPGSLQKHPSPLPYAYNDPRRLSVNSLLTQEAEAKASGETTAPFTRYGIDRGLPDLDLPNNDDTGVIGAVTPATSSYNFHDGTADASSGFGFGLYPGDNTGKVNGYPEPIQVDIPNSLNPLPRLLLDNKMNLMYFHFFLEFTAPILVPHDCPANPFKFILPQMAVRDDNLLHLLLAYSASHRARMLGHPEPANRIAVWVKDVFPNLRHALDTSAGKISNTNLATAIMLASLEIIAPNTFEVAVPWQVHLNMARSMIIARGGPAAVNGKKDRVSYFLIRWFAYLDVLGNFSSTGNRANLAMFSPELYDFREDNDFQIDCVLGFSGYLASILARISDLARRCDNERIDDLHNIDPNWRPSPYIEQEAQRIQKDLQETRLHAFVTCPHKATDSDESAEMEATNEAFFWAGVIHFNRRILGLSQNSDDVQEAVDHVVEALEKVKKGGVAEACMLFPIFSAGCEAVDPALRSLICERVQSIEGSGMTQVREARQLMEKVWETGRPWETLVQGEFFG